MFLMGKYGDQGRVYCCLPALVNHDDVEAVGSKPNQHLMAVFYKYARIVFEEVIPQRVNSLPASYDAARTRSRSTNGRVVEVVQPVPDGDAALLTHTLLQRLSNVGVFMTEQARREAGPDRLADEETLGTKVFAGAFYLTTGRKLKDCDYVVVPMHPREGSTDEDIADARQNHRDTIDLLRRKVFRDFDLTPHSPSDQFYVDIGCQINVDDHSVFFDRSHVADLLNCVLGIDDAQTRINHNSIRLDTVGLVRDLVGIRMHSAAGVGDKGVVFCQFYSSERAMVARKCGNKSGMSLAPKSIINAFIHGQEVIVYINNICMILSAHRLAGGYPAHMELRLPVANISGAFWGVSFPLLERSCYAMHSTDWA